MNTDTKIHNTSKHHKKQKMMISDSILTDYIP